MGLPDVSATIASVGQLCSEIEKKWTLIQLPPAIKNSFIEKWREKVGYGAESTQGQVKLFTSESNAEYIADVALAKAIIARPLYEELAQYRNLAILIAVKYQIGNFEEDFAKKINGTPPHWHAWEKAIEAELLGDQEEIEKLKLFLTNSDAFGGIKGIGREDFASPAIVRTIGHRVDRFGIADEIAKVTDESICSQVKSFITGLGLPVAERCTGDYFNIIKKFEQALKTSNIKI